MRQDPIRIYFSSTLNSAQAWRTALAPHIDSFELLLDGDDFDPACVDIALVWTVSDGVLAAMTRLRAVLSLGAGINQINCAQIPNHVPLARLVDPSLTSSMVSYARAAVFRYHRDFDFFEQARHMAEWTFVRPRATDETRIAILGIGEIGLAIARALTQCIFAGHRFVGDGRDNNLSCPISAHNLYPDCLDSINMDYVCMDRLRQAEERVQPCTAICPPTADQHPGSRLIVSVILFSPSAVGLAAAGQIRVASALSYMRPEALHRARRRSSMRTPETRTRSC